MTKSGNWKIISNIIECQAAWGDIVIEWQQDIIEWQTDIIEWQKDIIEWQTNKIEWQGDIIEWQTDIIESAQWIVFLIWKLLHRFVAIFLVLWFKDVLKISVLKYISWMLLFN